jgi:hypothetical protein
MPARAIVISICDDLEAAGGQHLVTLTNPVDWHTSYRNDGNHQMTVVIPTDSPGSDALGATTPAAG